MPTASRRAAIRGGSRRGERIQCRINRAPIGVAVRVKRFEQGDFLGAGNEGVPTNSRLRRVISSSQQRSSPRRTVGRAKMRQTPSRVRLDDVAKQRPCGTYGRRVLLRASSKAIERRELLRRRVSSSAARSASNSQRSARCAKNGIAIDRSRPSSRSARPLRPARGALNASPSQAVARHGLENEFASGKVDGCELYQRLANWE